MTRRQGYATPSTRIVGITQRMAHVPSAMRVTLLTLSPMNVCSLRLKMQIVEYRDLINVRNAMRVSTTVSYRINV